MLSDPSQLGLTGSAAAAAAAETAHWAAGYNSSSYASYLGQSAAFNSINPSAAAAAALGYGSTAANVSAVEQLASSSGHHSQHGQQVIEDSSSLPAGKDANSSSRVQRINVSFIFEYHLHTPIRTIAGKVGPTGHFPIGTTPCDLFFFANSASAKFS